ncbi:hypothetical protein ACL00T_15705 [Curtobacterium flaccumfaciens]
MSRVLSTEQAKTAIRQVQSIINGGFTDQISQLDAQGRILSDSNVWDGPLAATFRGSTWPETKAALDKAKTELRAAPHAARQDLAGHLHRRWRRVSTSLFPPGPSHSRRPGRSRSVGPLHQHDQHDLGG